MTILSCKSILISCQCIPKLNFIFLQWTILILPKHFLPIWDYSGVISGNILNAHFVPPHCLSRTLIFNFVHHRFWPKPLQQLRDLLWFILINLISFGASQNTNVLMMFVFFFSLFCNGPFGWPITIWLDHYEIPPPPPPVKITVFTLFYT
jgi:hypothetical protein